MNQTSIRINIDVISMSGKISPDTLEEVLSSSLNKNGWLFRRKIIMFILYIY